MSAAEGMKGLWELELLGDYSDDGVVALAGSPFIRSLVRLYLDGQISAEASAVLAQSGAASRLERYRNSSAC